MRKDVEPRGQLRIAVSATAVGGGATLGAAPAAPQIARFCDEGCRRAAGRHERRRQTDGLYAIEDDVQRAVRAILGERLDRGESR